MAQEIERKYLINKEKWLALDKPPGQHYRQGYISTDPKRTIRVRLTDTGAYLTIKGLNPGATRSEFEYEIPIDDAKELLDKFSVAELSKTRYKINYANHVWGGDEFLGDNKGLIIAEIALTDEAWQFDIPGWVSDEVKDDKKYYNSNLTTMPFKTWEGKRRRARCKHSNG